MAPDLCCYSYKFFKFLVNVPYHSWNRSIYTNRSFLPFNSVLDKCILPRYLGTGHFLLSEKKFEPITKKGIVKKDGTVVKVKTKVIPQITLFDENGSLSVVTMEAAKRLAESKKLVLVDVTHEQKSTERRTYMLKTATEAVGFDRKKESEGKSKSKKLLMISTNISDNDLQSKIKIMARNTSKGHEVRIILRDENRSNNLESCFNKITEQIKDDCNVKNKCRKDANQLVFELEPFREKKKNEEAMRQENTVHNNIRDTITDVKIADAKS